MMRNFMITLGTTFLLMGCGAQKSTTSTDSGSSSQKIQVSEDAFVQGGNTADEAFGSKVSNQIRIFNSNAKTKYARVGLLKFEVDQKMKDLNSVTLHINLKVYEKLDLPNAKFHLAIYGTDSNWKEGTVTWKTAPKKGKQVGKTTVEQSPNGKKSWVSIDLNPQSFQTLVENSADGEASLMLRNDEFNNISAIMGTKEQNSKDTAYLIVE